MSKREKITVACPKCKKESEFLIWASINTKINPELKPAVRDLSAFRFICPECGAHITIIYSFLYHQMEDNILIYYADSEENAEEQYRIISRDKMAALFGGDYTIRIVKSLNVFLEKLAIFDHGLDDRVVELYKIFILGDYQKANPDNHKNIDMFYYFHDGEHLVQLSSEGEYICSAVFSMDAYERIRKEFSPRFSEDSRKEPFIDRQWALDILQP